MFENTPRTPAANWATTQTASYDEGLRTYMRDVYGQMSIGLLLSALSAFAVGISDTLMKAIYGTPLMYVVMLAPFGFLFFGLTPGRIARMSVSAARLTFWAFAVTMGLSMAYIFRVYTAASIIQAFLTTAIMFAGTCLYGYTTKADLSRMGSFMIMGLIGLVGASIVNIFLHSSAMAFALSVISVIVFTGLAAFRTQMLKQMYAESNGAEANQKTAVMGALGLYLDFINLFMAILRLMGDRR